MKDLLSQLSSYNLFNYLLPGIVFVVLADLLTQYSFIHENVVIGAFIYYFIGLVVSRFGSLIIEPILKYSSFIKPEEYPDFVKASKDDEKLYLLLEVSNSYRTLCTMSLMLVLLKIYEVIKTSLIFGNEWGAILLLVFLLVIFLFSYQKQTNYISKRVKANL